MRDVPESTFTRAQDGVIARAVAAARDGEAVLLSGPAGIGKSTLLEAIKARLVADGAPVVIVTRVADASDVEHALGAAGSAGNDPLDRDTRDESRSTTVLLLDHVDATRSLVQLVRTSRPTPLGILVALRSEDLGVAREIARDGRFSTTLRAPPLPLTLLRRMLAREVGQRELPPLDASDLAVLARSAYGRPGWVVRCAALLSTGRYAGPHGLLRHALVHDVERTLRAQMRGSRAASRSPNGSSRASRSS
jgi:energy-coupling factor transporter ATP-binding protein EcfA2